MLFRGVANAEKMKTYLPWLKMAFARGSWITHHADELKQGF
jgi:hypothetical protein